jgi:POT family proton-dependent oligopeptide transporter
MAINIGAMFAPSMAKYITNIYLDKYGYTYTTDAVATYGDRAGDYLATLSGAYGLCFGVACVSLVLSILIYYACRSWFKHADVTAKQVKASDATVEELTPKQTKDRIVALLLVFAVVIFFWMAFHQNGSALTFFAKKYTDLTVFGPMRIGFNIWSLFLIAVSVYTAFSVFQTTSKKVRNSCAIATLLLWAGALALYFNMENPVQAQPSDFQQFNPFFVVALTPFSLAIFGALAKKDKEPTAPTKIALGMLVAALGFVVITMGSFDLISPMDLGDRTQNILSPGWLISTYLTLTFAELLLSPMGISFVSKVAPPKYKGLMMGGWFVATAIGNYLSSIPSMLWNKIPLMANWGILIALCVISAVVMFALLKKLNAVTAEA